jgi:hypothetical protein
MAQLPSEKPVLFRCILFPGEPLALAFNGLLTLHRHPDIAG